MKNLLLLFLTAFFIHYSFEVHSQEFTSSNLPIVIITTNNGATIPDEPKIGATMKVIWRPDGSRNYLTDQDNPAYLNYNGPIGIEIRGSTSALLPKKPYGLETREQDFITSKNVSILGLPKENDWVLNSFAYDPSLMRDYISYELSRDIGQYSARSRYCEVILNGDYQGLYLFMEKLKGDSERINIEEISVEDKEGVELTGGYIIKADKPNGDPVSWTMTGATAITEFIHEEPEPQDITSAQKTYITDQFMKLKDLADAGNENILTGYPSLIDIPSFIDFMLINELAANVDAYQFSTYFHKDKGGKLRAGPVWDFNLTYGNDLFFWNYNRSFTYTWQFDNGDNTGPFFWKRLYSSPTFKCYLSKRWKQLTATDGPLDLVKVFQKIDAAAQLASEAANREQLRWGTVSTRISNIATMKLWLADRYIWLNSQLSSFSACANPSIPSLVISKINYNAFGDQNSDLEFLEITNTGSSPVNTAGLYFREPGISFSFPATGSIGAGQKIYLASNAKMFESFYGLKAFGEFERNLSNSSYYVVLVDAFGNVIDEVRYFDKGTWSDKADGKGSYLRLKDIGLDNSLSTSWEAAEDCFYEVGKPPFDIIGFCLNDLSAKIPVAPFPGTTLKWFEDEAGTRPLAAAPVLNTSVVSKTEYYISTRTYLGCESARKKVTVAVSPKPEPPVITKDLTNLAEPTLSTSESGGYQWFLYGIEISGATERNFKVLETGSYQVVVSNFGCKSDLSLPVDLIVTGIDDQSIKNKPQIFPNPTVGSFRLKFPDGENKVFRWELFESSGRKILSGLGAGHTTDIDISAAPEGSYLIRIFRKGSITNNRVIKINEQ